MTFIESGDRASPLAPVGADPSLAAALPRLRGPVEAALRGNRSAGDIAYRLGELVHNHFRTQGKALTSFELRRFVVDLLDHYRRGWPTLAPVRPPVEPPSISPARPVPPPGEAFGSPTDLVSFARPDLVAARRLEATPPQRPLPETPSPLVSLAPRRGEPAPATPPALDAPMRSTAHAEPIDAPLDSEAAADTFQRAMDKIAKAASEAMAPPVDAGAVRAPTPVEQPAHPPIEQLKPLDGEAQPRTPVDAPQPPPVRIAGIDEAWEAIRPAVERRRAEAPQTPAPRRVLMAWARPLIDAALAQAGLAVAEQDRTRLDRVAVDDLFGLGPLEAPLADEQTSATFINGPSAIFVERAGKLQRAPVAFRDDAHLLEILARVARRGGVEPLSETSPLVEGRFRDGVRFTLIGPPVAARSVAYAAIRKSPPAGLTLEALAAQGMLSPQLAEVLKLAIRGRLNVAVCGPAESGKSALLAALARAGSLDDRVVAIERGASLRLQAPDLVSLTPPVDPRAAAAFAAAALRMRPDRIVIDTGGARDAASLLAASSGKVEGMLLSIEAGDSKAAIEQLVAAVGSLDSGLDAEQVRARVESLDLVLELDGRRDCVHRVTRVADFGGKADRAADAMRSLFEWRDDGADGGRHVATGAAPKFMDGMRRRGLGDALAKALE